MQGCLGQRPPASQVVEGVTHRRGPCAPRAFPRFRATTAPSSPSRLRLLSRWTGSTPSLAAAACAAGRGGLRPLLRVSLAPCSRSHPAGVSRRLSQSATAQAACALPVAGSASGAPHLRGHRCVRWRSGLETRPPPVDEAGERLQKVGVPSPGSPSSRALAFPREGDLLLHTPAFAGHTTGRDTCRIIRLSGFLVSLTLAYCDECHHDMFYRAVCSCAFLLS